MLEYSGMLSTKEKYKYVHLIKELAVTDFKLKYQGSVFGYLWSLVKPLGIFGVLYVVFTSVFKLGSTIPHYPIYLFLGVVIFEFWSEATSLAMNSIVSRGDLIRKIYFPRVILVISSTLTSLITFCLNMLIVFCFAVATGVQFHLVSLLIIPLIFELYIFIVGVSFFLAAFYVKFRDVGHLWEVFNRMLFYATPIIYSITLVPFKYGRLMILSPIAQVLQDSRRIIIDPSIFSTGAYWNFWWIPLAIVALVFVTGQFYFNAMSAKFAEEV